MSDHPTGILISITQAAAAGIERVRVALWANQFDHFNIDIVGDGKVGSWMDNRELLVENEKMISLMREMLLKVGSLPKSAQRPMRATLRLMLRYFLLVRREGLNV